MLKSKYPSLQKYFVSPNLLILMFKRVIFSNIFLPKHIRIEIYFFLQIFLLCSGEKENCLLFPLPLWTYNIDKLSALSEVPCLLNGYMTLGSFHDSSFKYSACSSLPKPPFVSLPNSKPREVTDQWVISVILPSHSTCVQRELSSFPIPNLLPIICFII